LTVCAFTMGCDRNSGSTADTGYRTTGSTSSTTNAAYRDSQSSSKQDADNTGRNERDRSDATLTPGDQGNSEADREITRRIRRAINKESQLSTTAKNIKIITADGKVTLRGPVKTDAERKLVDSIVQQQGVASFDNQLEVKTTNQ